MTSQSPDKTEMEMNAPQPETGNQRVQLGIGTLIIIALIVTMCSGRSEMEDLQRDTAELKKQLGAIDKKLDTLVQKNLATISTDVEVLEAPAEAGAAASRDP